jgi:hypothetical protein
MNTNSKNLIKRWLPILEQYNVTDVEKQAWLSEYAQNHQNKIQESFNTGSTFNGANGLGTPQSIPGMGAIVMPQPGSTPGYYGNNGSADISPNLFPLAMKIAAQTIGLDLVTVQPTASPVFKHVMMDFVYSDGDVADENEKSSVFELAITGVEAGSAALAANVTTAIAKRELRKYFNNILKHYSMRPTVSGIEAGMSGTMDRIFIPFTTVAGTDTADPLSLAAPAPVYVGTGTIGSAAAMITEPNGLSAGTSRRGVLEFLGFSRVTGNPMFRAFRKTNTPGQWNYSTQYQYMNTFDTGHTIDTVMEFALFTAYGFDASAAPAANFNGETTTYEAMAAQVIGNVTVATGLTYSLRDLDITILPVSTMENHLDGFTSNWARFAGLVRQDAEKSSPMSIHPQPITRDIQVGEIKIKASVLLNQMEDIKAATGKDLLPLVEAQLANELTQRISKEIVAAIYELGEQNRATAPLYANGLTIFDFSVSEHLKAMQTANGVTAGLIGGVGETSTAIISKLWQRIMLASNYISTEGRIGGAQYVVTNYRLATALAQGAQNQMVTLPKNTLGGSKQLYPMGEVNGITIYCNPNQLGSDTRVALGRKNSVEEPGLLFVPYLMAQSVQIINPTTFAPEMILRSRYAVARVGWFPEKQFMTLHVSDAAGVLA